MTLYNFLLYLNFEIVDFIKIHYSIWKKKNHLMTMQLMHLKSFVLIISKLILFLIIHFHKRLLHQLFNHEEFMLYLVN